MVRIDAANALIDIERLFLEVLSDDSIFPG
jgi:hypothetical protein